jgi:hypothetical protein
MAGETFHGPPSHFESLYHSLGLEISHLTMIFLFKKVTLFLHNEIIPFFINDVFEFSYVGYTLKKNYCMYMIDGHIE